jgi:Fur family ferric uptake transcriptional regulator
VTVAPRSVPLAAEDLDAAIAIVRSRGLRLSAARRLVLAALFLADGPVTAEQIADGLGGRVPSSDLASTYRNLETLEHVGLVRHVHLGHGPGLYTLVSRGEREYVVCEHCGAFEAVPPARLHAVREAIERELGYVARFTHFPIVGTCADCARRGLSNQTEEHHAHP